ncbi:hypothetical protein AHAS_Ahas02G0116100 [Arachis hypogaea]
MRRQHGMSLDDWVIPYLETARLYHLMRLNDHYFKLDEPLMHTFHISFGECIITLQDVVYQLDIPINGDYVSGFLTNFERFIERG